MRMIHFLSISILLFIVAGCANTKGPDINEMMDKYYAQARTYSAVRITGLNELHLAGENMEIALEAPLNPLSMRSTDPNVALETINTLGRVAVAGLGIYTAGEVMKEMSAQPKTVDPIIVDRPVPFIPAAAPVGGP